MPSMKKFRKDVGQCVFVNLRNLGRPLESMEPGSASMSSCVWDVHLESQLQGLRVGCYHLHPHSYWWELPPDMFNFLHMLMSMQVPTHQSPEIQHHWIEPVTPFPQSLNLEFKSCFSSLLRHFKTMFSLASFKSIKQCVEFAFWIFQLSSIFLTDTQH